MNESQINLLDYSYPEGQMVEIPGRLLEGLIQILTSVNEKESTKGFIDRYPTSHKEVFNKENKDFLEEVKVDWTGYTTAESYFNQEPQNMTSMLGVMAMDLCLILKQGHLENIKNGVAIERGTFEVEGGEDVKLEQK